MPYELIDTLLTDLPTPPAEACLPPDAARAALHAIVRLASVRPSSTAAVYGYSALAEALGPERLAILAGLAGLAPPPP